MRNLYHVADKLNIPAAFIWNTKAYSSVLIAVTKHKQGRNTVLPLVPAIHLRHRHACL